MKLLKYINRSAGFFALALVISISMPAFAQHGSDDNLSSTGSSTDSSTTSSEQESEAPEQGTTSTSETSTSDRDGSRQSQRESEDTSPASGETETETESSGDLHHRGALLLMELRGHHHGHLMGKGLEKACQSRQHGMNTKLSRLSGNAQRMQARIDDILAKTEAYAQANNVKTTNYDSLLAAAQAAKTASATSVAGLNALDPTVDCSDPNVAAQVATYKVAAKEAHDNLKAYRQTVRTLINDLIKNADTKVEDKQS